MHFFWWSVAFTLWTAVSAFNVTLPSNGSLYQPATTSRNLQLKGVALGGWLVLEPYITPSLFLAFNATNGTEADIPVDEYHYCKALGPTEAKKRLRKHWDGFYNESDFETIKSYGLNMVRIPIGYWAFQRLDSDPYVAGAAEYLDKAISWAYKNDLKVWVDLHGVPGSQNGFDNSGYRDIGYPGWFNHTENVNVTYAVLQQIYAKYGGSHIASQYPDTVIGIEVVNEPYSPKISMKKIETFYRNTYADARRIQKVNNTIVFHDAFKSAGYFDDFMTFAATSNTSNRTTQNYNIMIDHHHYEVFDSGALNLTVAGHISNIKGYSEGIHDELDSHPAVVGEWSAALTDCAPWLNGVGIGTRWEGTSPYTNDAIGKCDDVNDFSAWSDDRKKNYRKFIEIQLDQYESQTSGWIFWCFKTETSIEWDLSRLVDLELFPQPLDDREYIVNGTDTDPDARDADDDGPAGKESGAGCVTASVMAVVMAVSIYIL
ncbi:exo-1,3-beta-glucanase [Yamadazyma tenuis ATCC 10573]|uniref:glucan 1,3-beta-glucosidase n=1 Tax=Candida tenuis (strain ATCC 10573 / BCRC 21748 / CBS 615 / JCM 9827 / NBRC 10315 / NRRL Y-1498 / VKM Y-70) TaxID=590646 RepID=G3B2F5_CANTC|nr:exo-1,3-beta-glucanase [Yamadazyma tenuis ATCC 10573]EGV64661.1 exo-1,3-beta-glucanase [Yamadazyma tenuis ATCC 10573]